VCSTYSWSSPLKVLHVSLSGLVLSKRRRIHEHCSTMEIVTSGNDHIVLNFCIILLLLSMLINTLDSPNSCRTHRNVASCQWLQNTWQVTTPIPQHYSCNCKPFDYLFPRKRKVAGSQAAGGNSAANDSQEAEK